jgi:hypothetical protein
MLRQSPPSLTINFQIIPLHDIPPWQFSMNLPSLHLLRHADILFYFPIEYVKTLNLCFIILYFMHFFWGSWDSSVGIATGYGLDERGVGVRVPVGSRTFFSKSYRPALGYT